MDFRLDTGQVELQQTVARFFSDRFPLDAVGARVGVAIDRSTWREMAELGMFSLLDHDGGFGPVEAVLVFEQAGSHLVPGPLLWSLLASPLVDGVRAGDQLVGGAGEADIDNGSLLVEHAAEIDVVLIVADDAVLVHRTADLEPPEVLRPLDPLTPVGRFSGLGDGARVGGAEAAEALRLLGTLLVSATLVGIAETALDTARSYALERHQFGVPIGSFQAIQHLLANMYVRHGLAQSATYAAAAVLAEGTTGSDPVRAVAAGKALAGAAAIDGASTAVQVLGGMGFTWDMLPNYLLKRAWVLEQTFGDADRHADCLGSLLIGAQR